ncbi:MAG TPA: GlsB/YeaQ/YmgE family stress response membrane protein [Lysobacter sp.]|nr:GlsB/YeaQ/YmgE family stress response membrane protein [Lysobacter sp.]
MAAPHTNQRFNARSTSMFEGVIGYIIGGAVIGILARFFKPGADPMGWILTILVGIAGALLGSRLAAMLNLTSTIMVWVWVCAIVAAIILLFIYEVVRKKTVRTA